MFTTSNRQRMLLNLNKNGTSTHQILTKRGRLGSPNLSNNILKPSIIEQKLRQHLFQNLHPVPKIGKEGQNVAIHLLNILFPGGCEFPHEAFDYLNVHVCFMLLRPD